MMSTEYDTGKIDEGFAAPIDQSNETVDGQIDAFKNNYKLRPLSHSIKQWELEWLYD